MLLELNEQLLKKHGFDDVWKSQKQTENSNATLLLKQRLEQIEQIDDFKLRWEELFRGVLAGNIFDSGATAVQEILNDNRNFGLHDALQKIPERPWLIDSFDHFIKRLENVNYTRIAARRWLIVCHSFRVQFTTVRRSFVTTLESTWCLEWFHSSVSFWNAKPK